MKVFFFEVVTQAANILKLAFETTYALSRPKWRDPKFKTCIIWGNLIYYKDGVWSINIKKKVLYSNRNSLRVIILMTKLGFCCAYLYSHRYDGLDVYFDFFSLIQVIILFF